MGEENESGIRGLLFGEGHSESEDKALEYVAHRLKEGAHLRDVLEEEYVVRHTTQSQRNEMLTDPKLVREDREGLEQDFESDELDPERPSEAAKGRSYENPRRRGRSTREIDPGDRSGSRTAVHGLVGSPCHRHPGPQAPASATSAPESATRPKRSAISGVKFAK